MEASYLDALKRMGRALARKEKAQAKAKELWKDKPPRVKKKRKVGRKGLVKEADRVFSLHIRAQWPNCFVPGCGKPTADCFHFLTRSKRSIRWDPRNAVGSCKGHNILYEGDQGFIVDIVGWFVNRYGQEAWDKLKYDGNKVAKHSDDDLRAIIEKYKGAA